MTPSLRHSRLARLVFLLLLLACSALARADKLFLWEVEGAHNRVYLLGTVHFARSDAYPLPDAMERAFRRARVLAVELDPTDLAVQQQIVQRGLYAADDSLRRHLPADTYRATQEAAARIGLQAAFVDRAKPWLMGSALIAVAAMRAGYQPDMGIDSVLVARAKAEGKQVVELESADLQLRLFESMTPAEQVLFVKQALETVGDGEAAGMFDTLFDLWRRGDTDGMAAITRLGLEDEPLARDFIRRLLTDRNVDMAAKVERLLAGGDDAVVAVGAAHLAGPGSLVELLARRGYAVRQVSR